MSGANQPSEEVYSKLPQWFNLDQSDHTDKAIDVSVTGDIPKWINGSLYRNGPGLFKLGDTAKNHALDGLAAIHRWTFKDGKVTYQSTLLDTDDYKKSEKFNRIVGRGFARNFPDPCQTIFGRLLSRFLPAKPDTHTNTQINIMEFGDRLFAMTELPLINEVNPDSLKVESKRKLTDYVMVHQGTAHPHVLEDGTWIYYSMNSNYTKAYNFVAIPPQPVSSESPFSGAKIVATAPSRWKLHISYTHSFGVTENYFVQLEQPLTYNLPKLLTSAIRQICVSECFDTYHEESMDIIVIERSSGKRTPITYKGPNGVVFHIINCYEDSNHVICDTPFYPKGSDWLKTKYLEHLSKTTSTKHFTSNETAVFARFVLPLKLDGAEEGKNLVTLANTTATAFLEKGSATTVCITPEIFEGEYGVELPRINDAYDGKKYRYFYGSSSFVQKVNQLAKFDLEEKRVLTFDVEDNIAPTEPVFLAKPGATKEDDGVVLCGLVANTPDVHSSMVVLDAETFQEIGRATLPKEVRMSYAFHGNFTEKFV